MRRFKFPASLEALASAKPLVIAAPMNGGINNPTFAAAVINAGGVGSFGFTYHTAEGIIHDIEATRALSSGPVNANFFTYEGIPDPTEGDLQTAVQELQLRGLLEKSDVKLPKQPYHLNLTSQLQGIWEAKPEMLTFHFGPPPTGVIAEAQRLGISVGVTATTVAEAETVAEAGVDFIVAQGTEAGGHQGTFHKSIPLASSGGTPPSCSTRVCCLRTLLPLCCRSRARSHDYSGSGEGPRQHSTLLRDAHRRCGWDHDR